MWKYIFKVGSTNSIGNAKCFSVTRTHIFLIFLIFTILLLCHIFKKENPFWEEFFFQRLTCWTLKRYHYSYFELLFALDIFFPTYWAIFIMALGHNLMFLTYIIKPSIFPNYGWNHWLILVVQSFFQRLEKIIFPPIISFNNRHLLLA